MFFIHPTSSTSPSLIPPTACSPPSLPPSRSSISFLFQSHALTRPLFHIHIHIPTPKPTSLLQILPLNPNPNTNKRHRLEQPHPAHALHLHRVHRLAGAIPRTAVAAAAPAGQVQLSPQLQGQSQLSPASAGQSQSPPSAQGPQMSSLDDTASTTTTNAALEARLANLEARVGAHLPPPYEGRGGV
ncbi:hypothetical protein C8J57DRAFT_1658891 [Mycena rebaudengoi]|nr:hypothetical protein C8J57DRAFT_1658891 [Mycena rebaudengoi]